MLLIPSLLSIVSPILLANVISSLTVYNFSRAIVELSLDFGIIVLTAFLYFFYHLISKKTTKIIVNNLQEYVYLNIKQNKNIIKIDSSTLSNIWLCADFNKTLLYKICFFIKSIILLGIIIYYEFFIGLILILISMITFLFLKQTNSKIQRDTLELSKQKQNTLELFSNIQQGIKLEDNKSLEKSMKGKYFDNINNSVNLSNKISFFYNLNNNFISLILKTAIFAFTIYLITLVKTTTLTLSLYLILTPYLTSSAENLIAFFELFPEIGNVSNYLKEFDALKFQSALDNKKAVPLETYNICFSNVSFNETENNTIKDVDIYIPYKSSAIVIGEAGCGKRAIFLMLSRKLKPSSGSILIDNKNIFDMSEEQFSSILYTATRKSFFYKLSIFENLHLVCQNKSKITLTLKTLGLKPLIDRLPFKVNSIIDEAIDEKLKYFLAIARAYLSGAKIICIYEVPSNFLNSDYKLLSSILKHIEHRCTIIMFSHKSVLGFKFKNEFYVENSKIKNT